MSKSLRMPLELAKKLSAKAKQPPSAERVQAARERAITQLNDNESEIESLLERILEIYKIDGFEKEVKFHPDRKWRFDFANLVLMIAIECEGVVADGKGRHQTAKGYTADCEKYNEATVLGWRVLRFTRKQVESGYAIDVIQRAVMFSIKTIYNPK